MGAAIFPENSKYGGGPEKMAIVAVRQRWRRCSGRQPLLGWERSTGRRTGGEPGILSWSLQLRVYLGHVTG